MALLGDTARGAEVNVTTAAVFIPELWSPEILKARQNNLVMVDKIMHVSPQGLKYGDTVHIPRLGNEAASDKTAGSAVTYSSATDTDVVVNITSYKYVAKLIEDIVSVQSNYDLFSNFTEKIGKALATAVDSSILALTSGFAAQSVGGHVAGSISQAHIISGIRMLNTANVPMEERYLVVDPFGYSQLQALDVFIRYDAGGKTPTTLTTGEVGSIYGVKVLMSSNVPTAGGGTATSAIGFMFGKDAWAIALQKDVTMKSEYSVDQIGTKVVGYEIYGVTYARTDSAVLVKYTAA
jgi:N4-gp56 family major capsid protein